MTQLTEHFALEELTFSSTATRLGIDNSPSLEIVACLTQCAMGLEKIRALLGQPMHIDSGYRCPDLNKAVGGAADSAHMQGYAADFICPAFGTPLEIVHAIQAAGIPLDQCIQEGTWVHVSFAPAMRNEYLTAHFADSGATYTEGVA